MKPIAYDEAIEVVIFDIPEEEADNVSVYFAKNKQVILEQENTVVCSLKEFEMQVNYDGFTNFSNSYIVFLKCDQ